MCRSRSTARQNHSGSRWLRAMSSGSDATPWRCMNCVTFARATRSGGGIQATSDIGRATARAALELGAQLVLFCGGDGTARDVADAVQGKVPIVGIPAGVKMHSAVFGQDPERAADMLADFLQGNASVTAAEVLDVDEE